MASVVGATLAVFLIALWIVSPRFAINTPTLSLDAEAVYFSEVIDWQPSLALEYLTGRPQGLNAPSRYQPTHVPLFNSLQWQTLGAPRDMTGPNIWNVARLFLFVASLTALVAASLGAEARRRMGPLRLAFVAGAPAALLAATPDFALDFVRLTTSEPQLVGGMVGGGLLLVLAARESLSGPRAAPDWLLRVGLPGLVGFLLWVMGVYFKEPSICFLVLAPFVYVFLDRRWRREGLIERRLMRYRGFQVLSVAMLVPILHMSVKAAQITLEGGAALYQSELPAEVAWLDRIARALIGQWKAMPSQVASPLWRALSLALPFLLLAAFIQRRRVPWLAVGLTLTGWAVLAVHGLARVTVSRYYLPVMALFAIAAVLALTAAPRWIRTIAAVTAALLLLQYIPSAHTRVAGWASYESSEAQLVTAIAGLEPSRCPIYQNGFGPPDANAAQFTFTVSTVFEKPSSTPCARGFDALLVQPSALGGAVGGPIADTCAATWRPIDAQGTGTVFGCSTMRGDQASGTSDDSERSAAILRQARIRGP